MYPDLTASCSERYIFGKTSESWYLSLRQSLQFAHMSVSEWSIFDEWKTVT